MELLTLKEIVEAVDGELLIKGNTFNYKSVEIDTRKISEDVIYIAIKGENFNGNDFAAEAITKGAILCIVEEVKFDISNLEGEASIIKVKDCKKALLSLASYYRSKLNVKIVGITGSTGKTSTKDLIAAALSEKYKVFKTKGNFNNDIGLPLMMLTMDKSHEVAVLEMGMSNLGEIEVLSKTSKPDIAVITNVGLSHIENLKTKENILKAKLEITQGLKENGTIIINTDNQMLKEANIDGFKIIKSGIEGEIDFKAERIKLNEDDIEFSIKEDNNYYNYKIEIRGIHNVSNSLMAIAVARSFKLSHSLINKGFKNLEQTSMRLSIENISNFRLINDVYNASPDSMKAAIDVLANLEGKRKICIFGTMKELGQESYDSHFEVGAYAKGKKIDEILAIGDYSNGYLDGFNGSSKMLNNIDEAAEYIRDNINKDDIVLVKASRSMKFENLISQIHNYFANERK